jgi:hypothetical protein
VAQVDSFEAFMLESASMSQRFVSFCFFSFFFYPSHLAEGAG